MYSFLSKELKRKNVIYARVSTSKQKADLENQINNIKTYMIANGIKIDDVYSDVASGTILNRKGFLELLDEVQNNKIAKVFITYKDRISRLSYELVVKLFDEHNTKIEQFTMKQRVMNKNSLKIL